MKKTLLFLKINWRSMLLLIWMIWITIIILDSKATASNAFLINSAAGSVKSIAGDIEATLDDTKVDVTEMKSSISSIESNIRSMKLDILEIESDVGAIENEVTSKHGRTLRATVEDIEDLLEKSR